MKKLRKLTPLRPLGKLEQGEDKVGMHVDEINQVVHLIDRSKTEVREELQSQLDEVKEGLRLAQNASKTLAALWALTTLFAISSVLILAYIG
jgi:hypothetical protein